MATPADPLLEKLVDDFGANYGFALDLLQEYRRDRKSVDATWREYFDKATGVPSEEEPVRPGAVAREGGSTQPVGVIADESPEAGRAEQARAPQSGPQARPAPAPGT